MEQPQNNNPDFSGTTLISKGKLRILVLMAFITILGYLLFSLFAGWDQVKTALREVGIIGALVPMSLAFVGYLFRFARWTHFLHILGHKIPLWISFRIYIGGFALSITPGKTGEAVRSVFLKKFGVPYRESFGAFLAERFSDVMAVMLLAAGGLMCCPQTRPILFIVLTFVLTILFLIQSDRFLKYVERWMKKALPKRFEEHVTFVLETVLSFRKCFSIVTLLFGILLGAIAWGLEGLACYYLLKDLNADISLFNTIFIYAFALLVGAMTFLPAGIGGAELTLLQLLIFYNVPASTAVAVTIVIRLTTLWFSVLLGMLFLPRKMLEKS